MAASISGQVDIVQLLLTAGADINIRDRVFMGNIIIDVAIIKYNSFFNVPCRRGRGQLNML